MIEHVDPTIKYHQVPLKPFDVLAGGCPEGLGAGEATGAVMVRVDSYAVHTIPSFTVFTPMILWVILSHSETEDFSDAP